MPSNRIAIKGTFLGKDIDLTIDECEIEADTPSESDPTDDAPDIDSATAESEGNETEDNQAPPEHEVPGTVSEDA